MKARFYYLAALAAPLAWPVWRFVVHPVLHGLGIGHPEVP